MNITEAVKARLGITIDSRDDYINLIIDGLKKELKDVQGLTLDEHNPSHFMFIVDYVTYRYSNHGEQSGMPRHLQWRLHNLMVGGKDGNI